MDNTKLQLRLGEKGRLTVGANVAIDEESITWKCVTPVVLIVAGGSRTPFDVQVVGAALGMAYVEFSAKEIVPVGEGETLSQIFEIYISENGEDAKLFGRARVSRDSIESDSEEKKSCFRETVEKPKQRPTPIQK